MLLRNYYRALSYFMTKNSNAEPIVNPTGAVSSSTISGSYAIDLQRAMQTVAKSYGNDCVVFGDGDAAVTIHDYKLSGNTLNVVGTVASSYVYDADGVSVTNIYTLTNGSDEAITIKEMGICTNIRSSYSSYALMDRTLLDTPVTIAAGDVGQVTYTIRMNYPT